VSPGFGEGNRPADYPDSSTIERMLDVGLAPFQLWRTVVSWHTWCRAPGGALSAFTDWSERTQWVTAHPEEVARAFAAYDSDLADRGEQHLVLFDALDRTASDWPAIRQLIRGLLQVLLELRSYRCLRAKAFLRPDMLEDREVTAFPDASKVLATRVDLGWGVLDLYSLLWQRIGNAPKGASEFRCDCEALGSGVWFEVSGTWAVPERLRGDEELQKLVFGRLASPWMGAGKKRGLPYTWLPAHLADAALQVSPRSFLAALHKAAEDTSPNEDRALHYHALQNGVQQASQIRVEEIAEDHPWVPVAVEPLRGLLLPCGFDEIVSRWTGASVERRVREAARKARKLPPPRLDLGQVGLRDDLIDLGVLGLMRDGRHNMPDVFRVAFGLGRKGGVKPLPR
jgi:hypothetical protein